MSPAPRSPERFRERFPIFERKVYLNSCSLSRDSVIVSARGDGLRVSFHYYNIPEDVEALLRVLERNEELIAGVESRR